jgi:hypothetical protein
MRQTVLAVLRCGEFFYAPTGQKAHSTGQRPVKIAQNNSRHERAKAKRGRKKTSIYQHAKTSFPPNFSNKITVSDGGNIGNKNHGDYEMEFSCVKSILVGSDV